MIKLFPRMGKLFTVAVLVMAMLPLVVNGQAPGPDENTLVIAQSVDVAGWEPAQVSSRAEANIFSHLFATLYEISEEGTLEPYLATSYSLDETGTEITFTLNEGLTCHDGEALTAEDVAYTFNRAADPENAFTGNTPGFVFDSTGFINAEAISELEVTLFVEQFQSINLGLLAEVNIQCMDSYSSMTLEEAAAMPIGSGPYRFVEWVPDSHVTIERVPEFTLRPNNFETIVWRVIPEASTRTAELIAGNVDIIANVVPDQIEAINSSGVAEVQAVAGTRRMYVGFNFTSFFEGEPGWEEIQNTDVRVAMQYAVDVPTICETLLGTECTRASSMVNPPNDNPNLEPYPYDPEQAEALLDAAGYPRGDDGVRFEITLMAGAGRYLNDVNVVQAIGQYLSDVGVQTNVQIMDWTAEFVPALRQHQVGPLYFVGTGGGTWNAQYDMADLSSPTGATNYTEWSNPEWFSLREGLFNPALTAEETQEIVNQMLEVFYNDPPWLLLYFQPDFYGVSNRVDWNARRDEKVFVWAANFFE
ncbi:MAG: ABC transporter substrate-binding protein [Aggregatilineales bacterium]